jgi:hypothetical protein
VQRIIVKALNLSLIREIYIYLIKANKTILELKILVQGMMNKDTTYFTTICSSKFTGP